MEGAGDFSALGAMAVALLAYAGYQYTRPPPAPPRRDAPPPDIGSFALDAKPLRDRRAQEGAPDARGAGSGAADRGGRPAPPPPQRGCCRACVGGCCRCIWWCTLLSIAFWVALVGVLVALMLTARGNRMLESWGFEYIPHADGPGGTWTYYAGSAGREGGESGGAGSRFFESWLGDGKYRRVLGVSSSATRTEVRKAYRELVLKYHPDKNPGCTDCHTRISEINQAYEILTERLEHRERRSKPPP